MDIKFDSYDLYETPVITLANPNKIELGVLGNAFGLNITYNFNEISEMGFTYPYMDKDGVISPHYSDLIEHKLIHVTGHGWWIVQSANDSDDGLVKHKEVTAYSLEYELSGKKVNLLDGTYKFYDIINYESSLLGKLLNGTGWTIDYIDSDLWNKWRTFEVADDTVYGFLMNTVRNSYECIFRFDTERRKVSAYTLKSIVKQTDIFIGYDNLIKNCTVTTASSELYTAISVYGDEDLDISYANPLGTLTIYNYDYFKNENWMSADLVEALNNWEQLIELNADRYRSALLDLIGANTDLTAMNTQLVDLKTDLAALEQVQGLQISGGIPDNDPDTYEKTLESIKSVKDQIAAKEEQIATGQTDSDALAKILGDINVMLRRDNNFTPEQLAELNLYTKEGTFQDDTFITTDIMTQAEKQKIAIDLYDAGVTALETFSQPSYTVEIDSINYLLLKEYKQFTNQTDLGSNIYCEVERGNYINMVLLNMHIDFDNPDNFTLTFGNRYRLTSGEWKWDDLFGETSKLSSTVKFSYNAIKDWSERSTEVLDFMNGSLDATRNALVSSSNQEIVFDGSGLHARKLKESGSYDDKQMWLTSNTLAFTRDNWDSVSLALGEITLPNDAGTAYGLAADAIIGKMLVGAELYISNEASTFQIDEDGIKIKVTDAEGNESLTDINTAIAIGAEGIDIKISDAIESMNTQLDIKLGEITSTIESTVDTKVGEEIEVVKTEITQTTNAISSKVSNLEGTVGTLVEQTDDYVTFTDLSTKGSTKINGANITTGTISANRISTDIFDAIEISADQITSGTISVDRIDVSDLVVDRINGVTHLGDSEYTLEAFEGGCLLNVKGVTFGVDGIVEATYGFAVNNDYGWGSSAGGDYFSYTKPGGGTGRVYVAGGIIVDVT